MCDLEPFSKIPSRLFMVNEKTPGVKKARPSRKHQLAIIRLKSLISGEGLGPGSLQAAL